MAEHYNHLIQDVAGNIIKTVFFAKPNNITIIKDIIICNTDIETRRFSLAIVKDSEVIGPKHYIFYEAKIDPRETVTLTCLWTLDSGSEVRISADKSDVVSVNGFGITVDLNI